MCILHVFTGALILIRLFWCKSENSLRILNFWNQIGVRGEREYYSVFSCVLNLINTINILYLLKILKAVV